MTNLELLKTTLEISRTLAFLRQMRPIRIFGALWPPIFTFQPMLFRLRAALKAGAGALGLVGNRVILLVLAALASVFAVSLKKP